MTELCGDVVRDVVRRTDLDHVHTDELELVSDPSYGPENLAACEATRFDRAGTWGIRRVGAIDVEGQEDVVRRFACFGDRGLENSRKASPLHLCHVVGL